MLGPATVRVTSRVSENQFLIRLILYMVCEVATALDFEIITFLCFPAKNYTCYFFAPDRLLIKA